MYLRTPQFFSSAVAENRLKTDTMVAIRSFVLCTVAAMASYVSAATAPKANATMPAMPGMANGTMPVMAAANGTMPAGNMTACKSLGELAAANPNFKTILAAADALGLTAQLNNKTASPITILAPTDAAFGKLNLTALGLNLTGIDLASVNATALLLPANKPALLKLINNHIIPGSVLSKDLKNGQKIKTALGKVLKIKIGKNGVTIDGAKVTMADIIACNGVIHVIDSVLVPKKKN